jgi:hypothetical protein
LAAFLLFLVQEAAGGREGDRMKRAVAFLAIGGAIFFAQELVFADAKPAFVSADVEVTGSADAQARIGDGSVPIGETRSDRNDRIEL